jgi:hypothetical protein
MDVLAGPCGICDQPVIGEESGCLALEQIFHNRCFKCNKCFKVLSGGNFFVKDGLVLCEKDYYVSHMTICISNGDTFGTIQSVLISEVIYYIICAFGTSNLIER